MAIKSFLGLTNRGTVRKLLMATVVVAFLAAVLAVVAYAGVRKTISDQEDFGPYYADWYDNGEWVAFIFYRNPDCVPDDFNLLDFFDFAATECGPLTVEGFEIRKVPEDLVPVQAEYHGLGDVPVWFVSLGDYDLAASDDILTISELEEMSTLLIGSASFYQETLHPSAWGQGHPVPMKHIVARGTLEQEYESFWFNVVWFLDGRNYNMNIIFR